MELTVAHCPGCGGIFQKNLRNLCASCTSEEDGQISSIENALRSNRRMNNDQVAELTGVSSQRIRSLIRRGRLRLFDYPNLADGCDLCGEPIRQGKLCVKCLTRLKGAIEKDQEKLRQQRENVFLSKFRR